MVNAFQADEEDDDDAGEEEEQNEEEEDYVEADEDSGAKDKRGSRDIWSPVDGTDEPISEQFHQLNGNGPPGPGQHYLGQSESMGLLDAEGYKFLEESDSRSGDDDEAEDGPQDDYRNVDEHYVEEHRRAQYSNNHTNTATVNAVSQQIYEMRP